MMKVPYLNLPRCHESLQDELSTVLNSFICNTAYINGPATKQFEKLFAEFSHAKECVGVGNGTDAIELLLRAHNIGPSDYVLTANNTFIATAGAIAATGAKPVFIDVCEEDLLVAPQNLQLALDACADLKIVPKAYVSVNLYGKMCDNHSIAKICGENDLLFFEDSAQAHGAHRDKLFTGQNSIAASFSFFPGKNLGAFGDAGAIITSNSKLASQLRILRDHGRTDKFYSEYLGRNSRLDSIHAAVLAVKIPHLANWNEKRRKIARTYIDEFRDLDIVLPQYSDGHVYHHFMTRVHNRDQISNQLKSKGIASAQHYPTPLSLMPPFKSKQFGILSKYSVCEAESPRLLGLPCDPFMKNEEIEYVVQSFKECF